MEQGTHEWHLARVGKLTASRIGDAIGKTKSGWSATRANLMAQLLCERITGRPSDNYVSPAMQWGKDCEAQARAAYSLHLAEDVGQIGFVDHPRIGWSGCSPDGLVGKTGLVEIKAPNTATHLDTLLSGHFPPQYYPQIQWQLAVCGREWCDAVSFDPRVPDHLQLYVQRIPRDEAYIGELEAMAECFLGELEAKLTKLNALRPMAEAA